MGSIEQRAKASDGGARLARRRRPSVIGRALLIIATGCLIFWAVTREWKDDKVSDLTSFVYEKLKGSTLSRLYLDELPSDAVDPNWTFACLVVSYVDFDDDDDVPASIKNWDWVGTWNETSDWRIVFLVGGEMRSIVAGQYERLLMLDDYINKPACMKREARPYLKRVWASVNSPSGSIYVQIEKEK